MTYTEEQKKRVVACALNGIRDPQDLEAHRAWAAELTRTRGGIPAWLQKMITDAEKKLGVSHA
jgi:hypothetical protein